MEVDLTNCPVSHALVLLVENHHSVFHLKRGRIKESVVAAVDHVDGPDRDVVVGERRWNP